MLSQLWLSELYRAGNQSKDIFLNVICNIRFMGCYFSEPIYDVADLPVMDLFYHRSEYES
jgi:hypothetical protein